MHARRFVYRAKASAMQLNDVTLGPVEAAKLPTDQYHARMYGAVKFASTQQATEYVIARTGEFDDGGKLLRTALQAALEHAGATTDFWLQFLCANDHEAGGAWLFIDAQFQVGEQAKVTVGGYEWYVTTYKQGDTTAVEVFDDEGQCPIQYMFKLTK